MASVWFVLLAGLLIGYAILDGFDLGVGALHLVLGRTDEDRRVALNAIGPVWDGNEVWLIAWGATLFLAFPRAYAVGFSGFYLPLMIILWLLMGRGVAIEFRHHVRDPLWQGAWDVVFSISSLLLALLYGVAVGNVISGVPLDEHGYFQGLFEWMLNPYALLMGVFSVVILSLHGAGYLAMRAEGALRNRARRLASTLWYSAAALALVLTFATFTVRPEMGRNFRAFPVLLILPVLAAAAFVVMRRCHRREDDAGFFRGSSTSIFALLGSTAAGLYPYLLLASSGLGRSLTVRNAAAPPGSLLPALIWMVPGLILLGVYQVFVYRTFSGKVVLGAGAEY